MAANGDVYIAGACRTAIGRFLGSLSGVIGAVTGQMNAIEMALLDPATGKITEVQSLVDDAREKIGLIDEFLDDQIEIATAARQSFPDGFAYEGLLANEIQQQVFQTQLGALD